MSTNTIKNTFPVELQPQNRMQEAGPAALSTAELLAIVLRTGGDGESAMQLAERLLIHYGGMKAIAQASFEELCNFHNIGTSKASAIKAALELHARLHPPVKNIRIFSPSDVANLLLMEMGLLEQEELRIVLLDTRNCILKIQTLYVGNISCIQIRVAELFKEAIRVGARSIMVVHNHPSGDPNPSHDDVVATKVIVDTGKLLDIDVLDHLIIGDRCYVSMKERGLGF